jgi:cation-transporting ATPase E
MLAMQAAQSRPSVNESAAAGLTAAEVAERVARGQTNATGERTSRSFVEILRANLVSRFNLLLGTMLVAILAFGQYQDAIFGGVLVVNALIGISQELRAKRTLDHLAVLNAPRARVVRDAVSGDVPVEQVVIDDLLDLRTGDQVVVDGTVRTAAGLQVDESLLTGESEPVDKQPGDRLLSGSFVVAGVGRYQATAVGPDAYARRIATEARRFAPVRSELVAGVDRILRYVTWVIGPIAVLLFVSQLRATRTFRGAVTGTVAGLVGMVPLGLVLLTSIAFGAAALTLARRRVLVQELAAVEGLARVDVVCFDKTGTLTDGAIVVAAIERFDTDLPVEAALGALADDPNPNTTLAAVAAAFPAPVDWSRTGSVPFSSARKWSGASFAGNGTWVLGAPEMVLLDEAGTELGRAAELAATGQRVLVLARTDAELLADRLPSRCRAIALVTFAERVRPDAAETLAYFAEQGVALKVISGDSPNTVGAVARQVGMPQAERPVDGRDLPEDPVALSEVLEQRSVFGRVSPHQKEAMVTALQARGHVVAMTGDGVNDALALKLADIGIAMGSGAAATRAVAQLVLLDGRFASLPGVVAEGRRVTANIERVANVFITKTVWATLLAIAVGIVVSPYPLLPRDLTIIDWLTIGIPSFFLALAPNRRRYLPGFVDRVLRFTVPSGLIVAAGCFGAFWLARTHGLTLPQQRTATTIVGVMISLCVLAILALPMTWGRLLLLLGVVGLFTGILASTPLRRFYVLALPSPVIGGVILIGVAGVAALLLSWQLLRLRGQAPSAVVLSTQPP